MGGGDGERICCVRKSFPDGNCNQSTPKRERDKKNILGIQRNYCNTAARNDREVQTQEIYCTHSRMRWAVSVASVRGLRVVLRMLLLVRYIMLQTCTGERRPAPGPLTTTATTGPIGAKTWTHGCWLTAVETSHCCTGLEGRLDRNNREKEKKFVLDREWERKKETKRVQWWTLASKTSQSKMLASSDCPTARSLTCTKRKAGCGVDLKTSCQNIKIVLSLSFHATPSCPHPTPDVVKLPTVTVEMCSCWKSADWFDKMLGLQARNKASQYAIKYWVSTGSRKHRAESADSLAYAALRWVTSAVMASGAQKKYRTHRAQRAHMPIHGILTRPRANTAGICKLF